MTSNNEIVNLIAFLVVVLAILFACFGRKQCHKIKGRRDEEATAKAASAGDEELGRVAAP